MSEGGIVNCGEKMPLLQLSRDDRYGKVTAGNRLRSNCRSKSFSSIAKLAKRSTLAWRNRTEHGRSLLSGGSS